jgi:hypothetical protein
VEGSCLSIPQPINDARQHLRDSFKVSLNRYVLGGIEEPAPPAGQYTRQDSNTAEIPAKNADSLQGGAKSGALSDESTTTEVNLTEVVAAWSSLSQPIRSAIVELVRNAAGGKGGNL